MASRKQLNKHYPIDWEPSHGTLNQASGLHPLRDRINSATGALTVRFELPFAVWCTACGALNARAQRYNAVKTRPSAHKHDDDAAPSGGNSSSSRDRSDRDHHSNNKNYGTDNDSASDRSGEHRDTAPKTDRELDFFYSTPIWRFTMPCAHCNALFSVQTDPGAHGGRGDYVVTAGATVKTTTREATVELGLEPVVGTAKTAGLTGTEYPRSPSFSSSSSVAGIIGPQLQSRSD